MNNFDEIDEQISIVLEDYIIAANVINKIDGKKSVLDMSQKPPNANGACFWHIGKKFVILASGYEHCNFTIVLDKDCSIKCLVNDKRQNKEMFVEYLNKHKVWETKYVTKSYRELEEFNHKYCFELRDTDDLREMLTYFI